MKSYKLRIDSHDSVERILKGINKASYVFENNDTLDNPHTHYYLETDLKRDSIIKRVKGLSEYRPGNGFYSLRELQPEGNGYIKYHAYMLKEGEVQYRGFSDEEKKEIKEYQAQVKQEMKEKKQSKKTQLQKIEAIVIEEMKKLEADALPDERWILDQIIFYYREQGTLIRQFQLVSIAQTLCLKYVSGYHYRLRQQILDRI